MKHESIGIPLGLGQKVEVLTLPKSVPEWTGDRIQTNAKGQMRTNFVENEEFGKKVLLADPEGWIDITFDSVQPDLEPGTYEVRSELCLMLAGDTRLNRLPDFKHVLGWLKWRRA